MRYSQGQCCTTYSVMAYQLLNSLCLIAKILTKPAPTPSKLGQAIHNSVRKHEQKLVLPSQQGWIQVHTLASDAFVLDSASNTNSGPKTPLKSL